MSTINQVDSLAALHLRVLQHAVAWIAIIRAALLQPSHAAQPDAHLRSLVVTDGIIYTPIVDARHAPTVRSVRTSSKEQVYG